MAFAVEIKDGKIDLTSIWPFLDQARAAALDGTPGAVVCQIGFPADGQIGLAGKRPDQLILKGEFIPAPFAGDILGIIKAYRASSHSERCSQ